MEEATTRTVIGQGCELDSRLRALLAVRSPVGFMSVFTLSGWAEDLAGVWEVRISPTGAPCMGFLQRRLKFQPKLSRKFSQPPILEERASILQFPKAAHTDL
jgi:hypothetical protein